jgi:hypothetical protein
VAFVIGSPTGIDAIGKPDVSVAGVVAPVAVVVEIVEADNIMRKVLRGTGIVVAVVA